MPFTFAHPALVLPFLYKRKKIFSATGLVIGSIIPDFEAFITMDDHKIYSHTWLGIFWFDLPLAIITAVVFHTIVRDPFIKNLPTVLKDKFDRFTGFNWLRYFKNHFIVVISSVLIGILSHFLWDAFTHLNLFSPNATDSQVYFGNIRLYIFLQYSNSVIGLIILAIYMLQISNEKITKVTHTKMQFHITTRKYEKNGKLIYWILFSILFCITVTTAISFFNQPINPIVLIDVCISGMLLGLIVTPLILRLLFGQNEIA